MKFNSHILEDYGYQSFSELLSSLMPSLKYSMTMAVVSVSSIGVILEAYLGMSFASLIAFMVVMPVELISGIQASKEKFNSRKFSRFLFKLFYYLVLIFVTHTMSVEFLEKESMLPGTLFEWMHHLLIVHITAENIISISENVAKLEGKESSFYIILLKNKLISVFGGKINPNDDDLNEETHHE